MRTPISFQRSAFSLRRGQDGGTPASRSGLAATTARSAVRASPPLPTGDSFFCNDRNHDKAPIGSAHHSPKKALSSKPPSSIPDRYVQKKESPVGRGGLA